jgi:hypothetical protein
MQQVRMMPALQMATRKPIVFWVMGFIIKAWQGPSQLAAISMWRLSSQTGMLALRLAF